MRGETSSEVQLTLFSSEDHFLLIGDAVKHLSSPQKHATSNIGALLPEHTTSLVTFFFSARKYLVITKKYGSGYEIVISQWPLKGFPLCCANHIGPLMAYKNCK